MFVASTPLETERLTIRPYEPGDFEAIHAMFGRADVCRYLDWEPMDRDQARATLERRIGQTGFGEGGTGLVLAAVERTTGRTVGEFMLRETSAESHQGEIGWSLHPDAHGRGLATEGAHEMLRLGFEELGLHRISAGCDARNAASLRVMERLGMRQEARFEENAYIKGEWVGEIVCAILEAEWRAAHPGQSAGAS